jgi:3-dehydroquinate synthetase
MNSKLTALKQLELMNALEQAREPRLFSVIDLKVKNMLPQWLQFSPDVFWLNHPEEQKNLEVFERITSFFLKQGIQRGHMVAGIGGGATTDMAGFVAACIHRGVKWISVPTTLMGMVDAGLGGKTGVNTSYGKNLIGAFHLPEEVWICTDFLKTMSRSEILSGRGEILKYALLSKDIYVQVMNTKTPLEQIIMACASFKMKLTEEDFRESGVRAHLNLGHTLGHAFEHTLKIPHGIAVTMGIKYLLKAMKLDAAFVSYEEIFKSLLLDSEKVDLTNYERFDKNAFWSALNHDKKKTGDGLKLVLVDSVGHPRLEVLPVAKLRTLVEALSDFKT